MSGGGRRATHGVAFSDEIVESDLLAGVLFLLAVPSLADDSAQANRLMIETVKLVQESERKPSAEGKLGLASKAHDNG